LRTVSGGLGLRFIQCLCVGTALGCERLQSLHCHRVEYASRQPFGTGSLLLQILKPGHDPALIFQDNLRRMRSFPRCSGVGECRVKSVRRVTLHSVCGVGAGRPRGMDKYASASRSGSCANSLAGSLPPLSVKLRATFRCSLWVNQPKRNDWVVNLS